MISVYLSFLHGISPANKNQNLTCVGKTVFQDALWDKIMWEKPYCMTECHYR